MVEPKASDIKGRRVNRACRNCDQYHPWPLVGPRTQAGRFKAQIRHELVRRRRGVRVWMDFTLLCPYHPLGMLINLLFTSKRAVDMDSIVTLNGNKVCSWEGKVYWAKERRQGSEIDQSQWIMTQWVNVNIGHWLAFLIRKVEWLEQICMHLFHAALPPHHLHWVPTAVWTSDNEALSHSLACGKDLYQ